MILFRFAELRAHLTKPSPENWKSIMALLSFWPAKEEREMALEYTIAHLNEWPDELRQTCTTKVDEQLWPLFRALNSSRQRIAFKRVRFLANWPGLRFITHLDLSQNHLRAAGFLELSRSPHLQLLRGLRCEETEADDMGLSAFLSRFPNKDLKTLEAGGNQLTEQFVHYLEKQSDLSLETLDLSRNPFHQRGLKQLFEGSALHSCQHLSLEGHPSLYREIRSLVNNEQISSLRSLNLSQSPMLGDSLPQLGEAVWPTLESLDLSFCDATNEGLREMWETAAWPGLTCLKLSGNFMGADACRALSRNTSFRLEHLHLNNNPLGEEGLIALQEATWLSSLRSLCLDSCFEDEGALGEFLLSDSLSTLQSLSLESNRVEEESFLVLLEGGNLRALKTLNLSFVQMNSDAMLGLTQAPSLSSLEDIRLSSSAHELDCFEHLQAATFRSTLLHLDLSNAELNNEHLRQLRSDAPFQSLRSLSLHDNGFDDEGLWFLSQSEAFPALETLSLWNCLLTKDALLHLLAQPGLRETLIFLQEEMFSPREWEELRKAAGERLRCV